MGLIDRREVAEHDTLIGFTLVLTITVQPELELTFLVQFTTHYRNLEVTTENLF